MSSLSDTERIMIWFARGCALAKHAKEFQQVLMGQESHDGLSLFTLASGVIRVKSCCGYELFSVQI